MREQNYNINYKVKRTPLVLKADAPAFKRVSEPEQYWSKKKPIKRYNA